MAGRLSMGGHIRRSNHSDLKEAAVVGRAYVFCICLRRFG
jgi:hypothetical protein